MTGGVVYGGWEFVIAAYGITFTAVALYAGTVIMRFRSESKREARDEQSGHEETR